MYRSIAWTVLALVALAAFAALACSNGQPDTRKTPPTSPVDSGVLDAGGGGIVDGGSPGVDDGPIPDDGGTDAADGSDAADSSACAWGGAPGECMDVSACAAIADHTSYAGECPGPAAIECCIVTPSTADNPPVPAGYQLMQQSQVTPAMTTWAVAILNDPVTYPMFSTTTMTFGTLTVLARVEWHPPDFQNSVIHRGVTLYEPI